MAYPEHMQLDEIKIIDGLLDRALNTGRRVTVYYETDTEAAAGPTMDRELITAEIGACWSTTLRITGLGWIWLVHGNGEDVVADHTDTPAMHSFVWGGSSDDY